MAGPIRDHAGRVEINPRWSGRASGPTSLAEASHVIQHGDRQTKDFVRQECLIPRSGHARAVVRRRAGTHISVFQGVIHSDIKAYLGAREELLPAGLG